MDRKSRRRSKRKKRGQREKGPLGTQQFPQEETVADKQPSRGSTLWLFRLAALFIVPALVLIGLEIGLRIFDYGVPAGFTFRQKIDGQQRVLSNPYFTWRFFAPQLAREINHFSLPVEKADGVYRIFVIGGSAAQGTPDPAYGMTRMLDAMLRDQYPGVDFDVINAAITAVNSHVVLPIARDCSRLGADLFIIYLGNNEVVGPYGAGTIFSPIVSNLSVIRTGIALKATRLGQLLSRAVGKVSRRSKSQPGRWRGMEMFLDHQVRATDAGLETVYRHFERNLTDICRTAQESGAQVVISTVGANLKDCSPFASLHDPGLSVADTQAWGQIVREGEMLQEQGRFGDAIERYLQAESIDTDYAELHFRLGRCYWATRSFARAKASYVKARELDALRFRADARINEVVRRVSSGRSQEGIHLVDSLQTLEANSPGHTPGNELFYEHVHLNFHGTYLVARGIFNQVQRVLPAWIGRHASGRAVLSERECERRLAYTGWSRLAIAEGLLSKIQKPPFAGKLYTDEYIGKLSEQVRTLGRRYSRPEGQREVLAQYLSALDGDDTHWRLHHAFAEFQYRALDNPREAEEHLRIAIKQCPLSPVELSLLGDMLFSQGEHVEAEEYYRRALTYDPFSTQRLFGLGMMLMDQGKHRQAIPHLRRAIEIDPQNATVHSNLGVALDQLDDPRSRQQAAWHLKRAVAIEPDLAPARANLANHYADEAEDLLADREIGRARELLQEAVGLVPQAVDERYGLALLLNREGNRAGAVEQLTEILRIDPNHRKARKLLSVLRAADN